MARSLRARAGRALRVVLAAATCGTFLATSVGGLLLHLDLAVTRRTIARVTNRLLHPVFRGRLTIEALGRLDLGGVDGARVRVDDPEGRTVLVAYGVHARMSWAALYRGLRGPSGAIALEIPEATVDYADVRLDTNAQGIPGIAEAFTPTPSPASSPGGGPGRPVSVTLPRIYIRHAWVHGQPAWAPPVDVEVDGIDAQVLVKDGGVRVDARQANLRARALPVAGTGAGAVRGTVLVPSPRGNPVAVTASFAGAIGGIDGSARFSLDGDTVGATLDLVEVAPERVRSLVPDYPVQDLLTAHVDAHGDYPSLAVEARAALRGGGVLATSGDVVLSADKHASMRASLAGIDLRGLAPGMPVSSLGATVDATLALAGAVVTGSATVTSKGGTVGGQVLPAANVQATFSSGAGGFRADGRVDATVEAQDPGLSARADLHLHPRGGSLALDFQAKVSAPRVEAVKRFTLPVRGSLDASARGTLVIDALTLSAVVDARARDVAVADVLRAASASGTARVSGSALAPRIDAKIEADAVDVAGSRAEVATVTATGLAWAPHVRVNARGGDLPDVDLEADVRPGRVTLLRDVRASLARAADAAELRADSVQITPGGVVADGVRVDGLGGPVRGSLRLEPDALLFRAHGEDVDVGRASRLAGARRFCTGGVLGFDVDARLRGAKAEGRAAVDLRDADLLGVHGASAHAELTLDDRDVAGKINATLGEIGTVEIVGDKLHVGKGSAASLRSWQRVGGALEVHANVDAARLDAMVPEGASRVRVEAGRLEVAGRVKRDSARDDTPHVAVTAKTTGLVLAVTDVNDPKAPARRVQGLDVELDARVDGESAFAELAGRVVDRRGPLVAVDAKSTAVPYAALFASPDQALERLSKVPVEATLAVPSRDVSELPAALGLAGIGGVLAAELTVHGTPSSPDLRLAATLKEGRTSAATLSFPVDLGLASHYAAGHVDAELVADARRGRVLAAEAHADGDLVELLAGRGEAAWQASARAHLDGFPLGGVGAFDDRRVRGLASGDLSIEGLHRDARATVDLTVEGLQVGDVDFKEARVHVSADGRSLDGTARLDHGDGSADLSVSSGATWGAKLLPRLEKQLELTLTARQFRAETLLPFAHDTLAELEGRIDGRTHVAYEPADGKTSLDGKLVLTRGRFEMSQALGELHDATATVTLTPDGVVRLEDARASGVTGRVEAAATARLTAGKDGLSLGGLRARIQIPKKAPLPVTVEGTPLGTIDGVLDVNESTAADGRSVAIGVDVPSLHVVLPESGSRSLQGLGELGDAEIGVRDSSGHLVRVPLGPMAEVSTRSADARRIEITTHLGSDVEIKRGVDLKVGLEGQPVVSITDKVRVNGQIRLRKGGTLDVQGKSFEVEKGTVTFVGDDPENPQVVVTAGWNAPDGTRIYADYIGPLRTGKVTLRSEPSLAQTDIVSLLLFGTPEGQSGSGGGQGATNSATGTTVGAAGGVATQPINHALDQFGVHGVAARVDTSQAANPKPEVELQIAKDISVQIAVVIGTPPPGANPDTTLLTLNWRLLRGLSVATTVGNSGSSIVDMVWERRY